MVRFLYDIVSFVFYAYTLLVFVRVILSWVPHDRTLFIFRLIYDLTEPFLGFFRRLIPIRSGMPFDFSPIIAILALQLSRSLLLKILGNFL
ncbi:MAG: YggT family protein [Clostridiales bacterium]|nr:YggT family protein [Clostridiales bacterium]